MANEAEHPLYSSKEWYRFVSDHAVHDEQVRRHLAAFMDAQTKLNERLLELIEDRPELDLEIRRVSEGHTLTGSWIAPIQRYHHHHGHHVTAEQLSHDARQQGIELFEVVA